LSDEGGKNLLEEKEKKKAQDKALKTDYDFLISAGYANISNYGSAINASMKYSNPTSYGLEAFYGFEEEYLKIGFNLGLVFSIRLGTFALMPFGDAGLSYIATKESKHGFGFPICFSAKGGIMFTVAKAPGLFGRLFYEYNFHGLNDYINPHGIFGAGIGYGF
jgi:hypothetical protein